MPAPTNYFETEEQIYDFCLANGDPVVAVITHDGENEAITLGTGFDDTDDLLNQLSYAHETGNSTRNIIPESARKMRGADSIEFYTIAGQMNKVETEM